MQTTRFAVSILQPVQGGPVAKGNVRLPAQANWVKGTVLGFVTGTGSAASEVHTLTFGGTVSGGTFVLQWAGPVTYTSGAITYSATAATMVANIQAALDALFGAGNTVVAGTGPYTVTFAADLANKNIPIPTVISSLTGTSPTLTPTETTVGHPGSGLAVPYNDASSDGRQVARCILIADTQTDIAGQLVTNIGSSQKTATEVFTQGDFYCSDLTGLDANGVADLGRVINATAHTATGAILRVR